MPSPGPLSIAAGTRLAQVSTRVVIYTVASRTYEELTRSGIVPAWLPDGRRLVYTGKLSSTSPWGRELMLLGTATRISTPVYSSPGEIFGGAGLSPDAREIYVNIYREQADIALARLPASAP